MLQQTKEERKPKKNKYGIIDCDVHVSPQSLDEIRTHLDPKWHWRPLVGGRDLFAHPTYVNRTDAKPPNGLPVASDPDFLRKQLIDEYGITHAILLHRAFCNPLPYAEFATVKASAFNNWLDETWLGKYNADGVFKGSIQIAHQNPVAAAREIERWAGHPHFVQVLSDSGSRAPYGNPIYDPIFEACQKHNLPFSTHVGTDGMGINLQASSGFPTHYIEWSTAHCIGYQTHLVSMLIEGVFERFPRLKVVLVEGGVSWMPALLWRLDTLYERYRSEVPWLKRKPSEYIRDHVRITSQPLERPDQDKHLVRMLELMDAENILMFSSDYPHWDFDNPRYAFPRIPESMRRRIYFENAKELYGL
ncbi:amidohydrolase family protein [Paenibacillus piri]|uniref:Amidohydrolase n=1 Tax=Paenibacillus piri TaxID=2547395 RepID=A0A4R5K7A6_9BACL|nr:amidohydrolase family protein [Paenibacillus piri]TDF90608.1 amidohydrolase [Paenibacillus piri]